MSTIVRLGNAQAINHATGQPVEGEQVTEAHIPAGFSVAEALRAITHDDGVTHGVWRAHSAAPAPAWVWSDDDALAAALAAHYGCPIGEPNSAPQED